MDASRQDTAASRTNPVEFTQVYEALVGRRLDAALTERAFEGILGGHWTPVQIGAFIASLRAVGETSAIIAGAVRAMRGNMVPVAHGLPRLLDTCGTGGDSSGSINLSTGAAVICSALGVPVAKHGNRAVSSRAGSADVVSALGIPLDLSPAASAAVLREANITFLMAPVHHPAMRFAGPVRADLKIRTIFNCLGPLANPASATHQIVGAFSEEIRPVMARALLDLGIQRAWVVRGADGMDEVSPYGATRVAQVENGECTEFEISPADFGLPLSPPGAATGGDAAQNAQILEQIFRGEAHPARDALVLNAAAALVVAESLEPRAAADKVKHALDSGRAQDALNRWRESANSHRRVQA